MSVLGLIMAHGGAKLGAGISAASERTRDLAVDRLIMLVDTTQLFALGRNRIDTG